MRDILFRGKNIDLEWIEGDLLQNGVDYKTAIRENKERLIERVIFHTVGQYTGLTDKNDKKIFEGDIVRVTDDYGETNFSDGGIGDVMFYDGLWYVGGEVNNGLNDLTKVYYVEVIGNIHDNSELLSN